MSYFSTNKKEDCTGCSACAQICPVSAIDMRLDEEEFCYPHIDSQKCIHCNKCKRVCDIATDNLKYKGTQTAFGGHIDDPEILNESTSGGAFTAIVKAFCDENYVIFGAEAFDVYGAKHSCIDDINQLKKFRQSKYTQSIIGESYSEVKEHLENGKRVLFSGTPCQIGGLKKYLGAAADNQNLLTVEVICEGVPSPLYIKKQLAYITKKKFLDVSVSTLKYRDKKTDRWDFEVMTYESENKDYSVDRWFNPFWSIWLQHLMSRPSCYKCEYATPNRVADITLGDLWGVHIYCPELYNDDRGVSLIICNSQKGKLVFEKAKEFLIGHDLAFADALKYQGPMRNHISANENRDKFMSDLQSEPYEMIIKKWARKPSIKLLISKYIYGTNKQICAKKTAHRIKFD